MKRAWLLAIIVVGAVSVARAETGMNTVVKLVEGHYSVRHHGVPLLWMAKPFMLGSGAGGLKMARFDNLRIEYNNASVLRTEVRGALAPGWSPFVERFSNEKGEWSDIYIRPSGKKLYFLIVTSKNDELAVIQLHASGKAADEWMEQPVKHAKQNENGAAKR